MQLGACVTRAARLASLHISRGGCYAFLRCVMWCGGYEASQYGTTALTAAAAGGSKDTVELLLDRGADLAAKDSVS